MIRITPNKPRTLRIGDLVVRVTDQGLELRGKRRRKWVRVGWNTIALAAIEADGYELKDGQRETEALSVLTELASMKQGPPRRLLP